MGALATPITAPLNYVITNQTLQLSNSTAGGVWSSSDITLATIDAALGLVTGVAVGIVVITYTEGGNTAIFGLSVNATNITNGFDLQAIYNAAQNRICWSSQGSSDSGRFWEDFHVLCDENVIKELNNTQANPTAPQYAAILSSLNRSIIFEALNSVFNKEQEIDRPTLLFNRYGFDRLYLQILQNTSQFVGICFSISDGDFSVSIKKLLMFFNKACTFNMYLYNDMIDAPISIFPVTVQANTQTVIPVTGNMGLSALQYISANQSVGGRWFIGYYQDDIQALGCNAYFFNITYGQFKIINPLAFSSQLAVDPNTGGRNWNRFIVGANNLMYGLNAEICSYEDPTNKIIQGLSSGLLDNLFGLLMPKKIIETIVFSYRKNGVTTTLQGNGSLDKLYTELNSVESSNPNELNFTSGLRKQIEDAKRVVKKGFQRRRKIFAGCG